MIDPAMMPAKVIAGKTYVLVAQEDLESVLEERENLRKIVRGLEKTMHYGIRYSTTGSEIIKAVQRMNDVNEV